MHVRGYTSQTRTLIEGGRGSEPCWLCKEFMSRGCLLSHLCRRSIPRTSGNVASKMFPRFNRPPTDTTGKRHAFPHCVPTIANPPFDGCAAWTKAVGSDGFGMAITSSNRGFFASTFSTFFAAGRGVELKTGGGRRSRTPLLRPVNVSLMANDGGRGIAQVTSVTNAWASAGRKSRS